MKKRTILFLVIIIISTLTLSSCDPPYPSNELTAIYNPAVIYPGTSAKVEIVYPATESNSFTWYNQKAVIVEGNDIISLQDLTITGKKEGTATIRVSVMYGGPFFGKHEEQEYIYDFKVTVESKEIESQFK